jgi:vacuolar iron transporter family protein
MAETSKEERMRRDSELLKRRALQIQRGAARAAVLGVNDGLVSVLCVVLAVAAATQSRTSVLIAGFAALIAGAISMAAGEWISLKSQVDLFTGVLDDLDEMVREDRPLLVSQLKEVYAGNGFDKKTAHQAAQELAEKDSHLSMEYARDVMGINPEELGSPWTAALSSFALFVAGSLAALLPWFFIGGSGAIIASIIMTSLGGILVGGYIAISSGTHVAWGALRQLFIIALASVVTYGVGHLFGVAVA